MTIFLLPIQQSHLNKIKAKRLEAIALTCTEFCHNITITNGMMGCHQNLLLPIQQMPIDAYVT